MATIEKRTAKDGTISYRVTVAQGLSSTGKQIRHRRTWRPAPGMTPRQTDKALQRFVFDFEREIEAGYTIDHKQTFGEYATYVIDLKERTGAKVRTVDRYRELMRRIDPALGHIKLADLRPQHLNEFYKNLAEAGIRDDAGRARARIDLAVWLKRQHLSRAALARRAGISGQTCGAAVAGHSISRGAAEKLAAAMGEPVDKAFRLEQNTAPLSAKTILEYHRLISTILTQAEKEMLVPYNAAGKATPPKVQKSSPDYYQPEELDKILDALEDEPLKWRALTYLLIDTGCRRGEAVGLKWECLNLAAGIMSIERALLYSPQRGVYESTPKTGKTRAVALAPETVALLRQWQAAQDDARTASGDRWHDSGFVFTQDDGRPMHPDSLTDWLNRFSARRGLPHIHPHAFRHTTASMLIASGVDLVTTANELGHSNATTTAAIYAHAVQQAQAKAAGIRSSVFTHRKGDACPAE